MRLMNPDVLVSLMLNFEDTYPGWWYSVSQKEDYMCLTCGPSKASPSAAYRYATTTNLGDKGRQFYHRGNVLEMDDINVFINTITSTYVEELLALVNKGTAIPQAGLIRKQSPQSLLVLSGMYKELIEKLEELEASREFTLHEVYVGSCSFSADCSLRGYRSDGERFDITWDMLDNSTIAEAFAECYKDLTEGNFQD